jgi:monooxygenase
VADIETDFCIVGGGPAGLTLALLLLRSGARVAVVERSRSLDREFRGDILQPGGMRLLADLGVLAAARERGSHEHDGFVLSDRGRVLMDADYRRLPGPYNCLLSLPQRHLLEALLDQCAGFDTFTELRGSRVAELVREGAGGGAEARVRGVVTDGHADGGGHCVLAHCVIGADGRYSKLRQLAGIDAGRLDVFDQDVLWFKLPADGGELPRTVQLFREGGNPALAYASVPDAIQCGWTLPHGGYRELAAAGVAGIKERLRAAIPPYAQLIDSEIRGLKDLTLLDVFAGCAGSWVADGLVLIGDAAHTHSPIGAQGINLAIQDAVGLHPVLLASLRERDASATFLGRFAARRRPDIDRIMKIQRVQSKAMLSAGGAAARLRPVLARVVSHTPIYRKVLDTLAFGNKRIAVAADLFTDPAIR